MGALVKDFLNTKGFKIDGFKVFVNEEGEILLKPIAQIPSSELWMYENADKINALKQGIEDIKQNRVSKPIKTEKQLDDFLNSL